MFRWDIGIRWSAAVTNKEQHDDRAAALPGKRQWYNDISRPCRMYNSTYQTQGIILTNIGLESVCLNWALLNLIESEWEVQQHEL